MPEPESSPWVSENLITERCLLDSDSLPNNLYLNRSRSSNEKVIDLEDGIQLNSSLDVRRETFLINLNNS